MKKLFTVLYITTQLILCVSLGVSGLVAGSLTPGSFVLANSVAPDGSLTDGFVTLPSGLYPGDPTSFDLTGGNNGSGFSGETDFTWTAPAAGTVQFLWSYTSCSPPNSNPPSQACDQPTYDYAGYLVGLNLTQLTDTDTFGIVTPGSFTVGAGQVFGWYAGTFDNMGEPGTLTVSAASFNASGGGIGGNTPEPSAFLLGLTGVMMTFTYRRALKLQLKKRKNDISN